MKTRLCYQFTRAQAMKRGGGGGAFYSASETDPNGRAGGAFFLSMKEKKLLCSLQSDGVQSSSHQMSCECARGLQYPTLGGHVVRRRASRAQKRNCLPRTSVLACPSLASRSSTIDCSPTRCCCLRREFQSRPTKMVSRSRVTRVLLPNGLHHSLVILAERTPLPLRQPTKGSNTPIALRKKNDAFHSRAGKRTPLKPQDPLDRKRPIPRWVVWTFLLLLGGGCESSPGLSLVRLPSPSRILSAHPFPPAGATHSPV